ncbi:hypothetical protein AAG906_005614 [Vitis piasezkii]
MESVGRLFCTSKNPSHGSTSSTAPPMPTPEATSAAPPVTPTIPPVGPTTSEPSITISTEFRPCHLGLLPPPQPDLPASSEPLAPPEDPTTVEVRIPPP